MITIPSDSIDISGESKDVEKKINIKNLLPDNVKLTSDSSEDVWVTVSIDLDGKKEGDYEVPVKIVLPDGYETVEDVTTEVVISSGTAADDSSK